MIRLFSVFLTLAFFISSVSCVRVLDATTSGPIEIDPGKRTIGSYVNDKQLRTVVAVNIRKASDLLADANIKVTSFNNVILLTGEVSSEDLRLLAGDTANKVSKVRQVHNEILVKSNSTFFAKRNDNWLHTKLRTKLLANRKIQSERVKIVVDNRIVYLMGLLSQDETNLITDIASNTSGVEKVVRAIEYID